MNLCQLLCSTMSLVLPVNGRKVVKMRLTGICLQKVTCKNGRYIGTVPHHKTWEGMC